jgi:AAA+ superfamily predicted ATPase
MAMSVSEVRFDLELESMRLRVLRAHANVTGDRPRTDELSAQLTELDRRRESTAGARDLRSVMPLEADDVLLVWAVVAATVDPFVQLQLAGLGPRAGRLGISPAQLAVLADLEPGRARRLVRRLAGDHALLRDGLIEVEGATAGVVSAASSLVASARLISFLCGDDVVDVGLRGISRRLTSTSGLVSSPARDAVVQRLRGHLAADARALILLQGRRGSGRRSACREAVGRDVLALELEHLPRTATAVAAALAALSRETRLSGAVPLLAGIDALAGAEPEAVASRRALGRFLDRVGTPVLMTSGAEPFVLECDRPIVRLELPSLSPQGRSELWRLGLGLGAAAGSPPPVALAAVIERAAVRFQLEPGSILAASAAARAVADAAGEPLGGAHLVEGVRSTVEERLHGLARRHRTTLTFDDVVLPVDTRAQLELLMARFRHAYQVQVEWQFNRHLAGPGIAALFSGPPGTGKTLVAGIIARELGLELYRVDLAQIVSKWIGETEKHLEAVFAAAEVGHAMLLFDEADALFAKRTEVRGATEKYANLEVNYLLQRIESFAGVALLTTNLDGSLDPAFRRRLAAHVQFPHPEEEEREALWRGLIPRPAPLDEHVDLADLAAAYPYFAGAHIRNAATTAAFFAAAEGTAITQALLRRAADEEARAMGRMVKSGGGL